jgi:excisionase family DNA binding protein
MAMLYSTKTARKHLGIGKTKLYELINSGTIKAVKQGTKTYFLPEDIETYISSLQPYLPKKETSDE